LTDIGDLFIQVFGHDAVYIDEPMKNHTSFKIGGSTDVLFIPKCVDDIKRAINICKENNTLFYIVGNGTNLLVKDNGYRGVIIKIAGSISNITSIEKGEDRSIIYAESGVSLAKLAGYFLEESLEGFEFASGIPGTLGGAICMNAGAYGSEMGDVIMSVDILDDQGNITTLSKSDMNFGYRASAAKERNIIILGGTLELRVGNKESIKEKMIVLNRQRSEKQPLDLPSAGSTFKRPQGHFAGKLIMDSGLKGFSIGSAQVSEKHSGFVVNKGNATAEDVINLIDHIKDMVNKKNNVELEQEVIIIGE